MKLKTIDNIPELNKENIHIKDVANLLEKINRIIKDGPSNLHIVTDFDHTLTRHNMDDGKAVLTSYGMFRECPSVPQEYKVEDERMAEYYKPIESDPTMSDEEKTKYMVEWYVKAYDLLKGREYPSEELSHVAKNMVQCFRTGVSDLISWSQKQGVPVLVFSAGLGQSVRAALDAAHFLPPNVKVVSNFFNLDSDGKIIGLPQDKIIHTFNKNETAIKGTEYYEMVKNRSNVILMGDHIGDAKMVEGMDHTKVVIKIGFLGRNTDANLQNYLDKFDIVLVKEDTMDVVNAILKLLAL